MGGGCEEVEIRYRSDRFTSRVVGVKVWFNSLLADSLTVRIEAYDGSGPKAKLVGEAADCEARDPATRLVTLPLCSICNKPVELDIAVTDQDRKPVHEECYVLKLRQLDAKKPPKA